MKKNILFGMLFIPYIAFSSTKDETKKDLDYCATVQSWAAQIVINDAYRKNNQLDRMSATSSLLERTKLVKEGRPIVLKESGQLYTQTLEVTIPYVDKNKKPVVFIASSIISAEECSLTEVAYYNITSENG
ncbi:hypothetical protein [Xenorhabdus doucetiae]|uniref:Uncharacterized protein n=1 Tax=Xenorhabdus doucetiae TaxID=351671 RepID=A0A068QTQ8_9GAMM|nr:hypothetical protein [Xenorhabdus doucetiae]TYP17123.1 hypothetical protein LY16_00003 [Xenorhabdus doucetiae]CDG17215.1 exported protein of unknown function [Xenorhabdus doucetiae]